MSIMSSSESQSSSQCCRLEEGPDLKTLSQAVDNNLTEEDARTIVEQLAVLMKNCRKNDFDACNQIVVKLVQKGHAKQITKFSVILQSLMEKFVVLCRTLESDPKSEIKILHVLSTIAELLKQAPPGVLCLKKGFIQSLLLIDEELVAVSPVKSDILAVLGVLYECISRQIKALQKFELVKQFKKVLLANYSLIDQQFSIRLFNKTLYNLAIQGEPITEAEFTKHGIYNALCRFLGVEQAQLVMSKLKALLQKLSAPKTKQLVNKRNQMVAEA